MRFLLLVVVLTSLAGCSSGPSGFPLEPPAVHIIHRYHTPPEPDHFEVSRNPGLVNVTVILENFYRNRCPAPVGEIRVLDPSGATYAFLQTENKPFEDCVYKFTKNETTLAPGRWTIQYSGGSENIGSIVDVQASNVTASR